MPSAGDNNSQLESNGQFLGAYHGPGAVLLYPFTSNKVEAVTHVTECVLCVSILSRDFRNKMLRNRQLLMLYQAPHAALNAPLSH